MCVEFITNKQQLVARRLSLDSMEEEEEEEEEGLSSRIPDLVYRYNRITSSSSEDEPSSPPNPYPGKDQ